MFRDNLNESCHKLNDNNKIWLGMRQKWVWYKTHIWRDIYWAENVQIRIRSWFVDKCPTIDSTFKVVGKYWCCSRILHLNITAFQHSVMLETKPTAQGVIQPVCVCIAFSNSRRFKTVTMQLHSLWVPGAQMPSRSQEDTTGTLQFWTTFLFRSWQTLLIS